MKIHCINLERATERKEQILKDWSGYDIEFFPAVDRRDLNDDYDPEKTIQHLGRPLTPGERGCIYSHIKLLEKFLETEETHFIVIEDDVKPLVNINEFKIIIDLCISRSSTNEIFILFEPYKGNEHYIKESSGDFYLLTGLDLWGTCGMLFTRGGAQNMIDHLKGMTGPADESWLFIGLSDSLIKYKRPIIKHIGDLSTYIEKTYRGKLEIKRKFID